MKKRCKTVVKCVEYPDVQLLSLLRFCGAMGGGGPEHDLLENIQT